MRSNPFILTSCLALGLFLAAACATKKGANKDSATNASSSAFAEGIHQRANPNEKITEYDSNRDGKPDIWTYHVVTTGADGKGGERLTRKELDINGDGRVDIVNFYGDKETIERVAMDMDFDGRVDQWNYYEKGAIVRKERDLDYNNRPDLWVYYEKGKIVRKERDTNGDGKIDYWEYWESDQVDRIGEDVDGDGNVDRWTKNPATGK